MINFCVEKQEKRAALQRARGNDPSKNKVFSTSPNLLSFLVTNANLLHSQNANVPLLTKVPTSPPTKLYSLLSSPSSSLVVLIMMFYEGLD